jgi:uncharacterized protein
MSLSSTAWSAPCFYLRYGEHSLLFKSAPESRHMKEISISAEVSGSIYVETREIAAIQGIQFSGRCHPAENKACEHYNLRFPEAAAFPGIVYEIQLLEIKYTDNSLGFGTKIVWRKS